MKANPGRSGMRSPAGDYLGGHRPPPDLGGHPRAADHHGGHPRAADHHGGHPRAPARRRGQVEGRRVRGGRPTPARRRAGPAPDRPLRLALWTTAVLTVGTIFGAAAFHVLLVQSQFRLDQLERRAGVEQQRYEQLRLDVARLAAPERVVASAQQRLGMVVPPDVSYLMAPTLTGAEPASATEAGEWSQVKPYLASRP
jgi:hypothetical protein